MFKKPGPPPVATTADDDEAVLEIRRTNVTRPAVSDASVDTPATPPADLAPATGRTPPSSAKTKSSNSASHSVIDELLTMRGDIETEGNVQIKGRVFGNVQCVSVIVEDGAVVNGEIHAQEVVVRGQTSGTIRGRLVRLESTAVVESDIFHQSFACEQGARIQGQLSYGDGAAAPTTTSSQTNATTAKKGVTIRQDRPSETVPQT
ncbi:MAG: polymer-forming cytoskeletal protein, partial [Pseudomonadota bacterium]